MAFLTDSEHLSESAKKLLQSIAHDFPHRTGNRKKQAFPFQGRELEGLKLVIYKKGSESP